MSGARHGAIAEDGNRGRGEGRGRPGGRGARPRGVASGMDGSGRWAERRGLPRDEGQRRGADAVRRTVRAARGLGLDTITVYAFSMQNWERPPAEVAGLMALLGEFLASERDEI